MIQYHRISWFAKVIGELIIIYHFLCHRPPVGMAFFLKKSCKFTPFFPSKSGNAGFILHASKKNMGKLGIDRWEKAKSPSLEDLFERDGVTHIGGSHSSVGSNSNSRSKSSSTTQLVPIMPFESPLFIHAREFLYIYERRFRDLMRDVEIGNQTLGRCFLSENGDIGEAGSLCRVMEKKQLDDGKGFYIIEAIDRFRIRRIVSTEPYLIAEVEMETVDDECDEEGQQMSELLCRDIYTLLKIYLRVQRLRQTEHESPTHMMRHHDPDYGHDTDHGQDPAMLHRGVEPYVCFQPAVYSCRPGSSTGTVEEDGGRARHEAFCDACANLLSTEPSILQQIFQSRSLHFRLHGIKRILAEAADELSSLMIEDGLLAKTTLQEVIRRSTAEADDDSDLAPPADYHEVTLDEEMGPYLSSESFETQLTHAMRGSNSEGLVADTTRRSHDDGTRLDEEDGRLVDWSVVDWDSKSTSFQ